MPVRHVMRRRGLITFEPDDVVGDVKRAVSKSVCATIRCWMSRDGISECFLSAICWIWSVRRSFWSIIMSGIKRQTAFVRLISLKSSTITALIRLKRGRPIYFRNQPLGCTATIITGMYHEHNVLIEPKIAGLLCSAILSDTLMFRSPTCTPLDRAAAEELAQIAGLDIRSMQRRCSAPARACATVRWMSCSTWISSTFRYRIKNRHFTDHECQRE